MNYFNIFSISNFSNYSDAFCIFIVNNKNNFALIKLRCAESFVFKKTGSDSFVFCNNDK